MFYTAPENQNQLLMHRSRVIFSFYCLTGIAAAFLTWVSQTLLGETTFVKGINAPQSITQTNLGDGWLTAACFIIILLLIVTGKNKLALSWKKIGFVAAIAIISLLISVYHIIHIFSLSKAKTEDLLVMKTSPGVGLYLTVIVSLLLLILPIARKVAEAKTEKGIP